MFFCTRALVGLLLLPLLMGEELCPSLPAKGLGLFSRTDQA